MTKKSIEQRLFEAAHDGLGLRLSCEDVQRLLRDDAIETRIANQACLEAGLEECGMGGGVRHMATQMTWAQFVQHMNGDGQSKATSKG